MATVNLSTPDDGEASSVSGLFELGILDASRRQTIIEDLIESQSLGQSIHDTLADLGTPYVSLGVLEKGRITSKIIGASSFPGSGSIPLDNETLFQAASISKPITAMAVMKLCQQGKLDLDAPISEYLSEEQLPWISTGSTLPLVTKITLRHLLSHTSGLSCTGFAGYTTFKPSPTISQILKGEGPTNNERITLSNLPDQEFHYSGGGFTVVQLILETRFKKPFYEIMDELVLQPLEMTRSTFKFLSSEEKNFAPAHMNAKVRSSVDYHNLPESAAAGLWTTPTDLLKAVRAVQRSSVADDFLEVRWAREMLTEVGEFGRGMGWRVKKGEVQFGHAGSNDPGYLCFVGGFAELPTSDDTKTERKTKTIPKNCGICVMTSSMLGMTVIEKIVSAVSYLKKWPAIPELELPQVPFMDRGKKMDPRAKQWCGKWGPGDWKLIEKDGLSIQVGNLPAMPLVAAACPPREYDKGISIDLVIDGLEMMLRLG